MKRLTILSLCLMLLTGLFTPALSEEKLQALPAIFAVSAVSESRYEGDKTQYIQKDRITTTSDVVNAELNRLVDEMDERYSPLLVEQSSVKAKLYNRLDIEINYFRTGESALSTLILARNTYKKKVKDVFFTTRTYDLVTGKRILLTDLFPNDSKAWDILSKGVKDTLSSAFPKEERDAQVIESLSSRASLEQAEFTLSGMELTLHYDTRALFPEKTGLMHVRFLYPQFDGMMTETGKRQTDNSRFKMVAITCDDGPRGTGTDKALHNFRHAGIRVTYFTVGKLYDESFALLRREYDANHLIANHSWNHWNGHGLDHPARLKQVNKVQEYVTDHLGETPRLFRAPCGTYPKWIESAIGLPIIQWSVDTYDFKGLSAADIIRSVRKFTGEGDIILMHDTGETMHKTIPQIAEYLWGHGFMPVTVEELAAAQHVTLEPNIVYHRFLNGDYSERRDSNTD